MHSLIHSWLTYCLHFSAGRLLLCQSHSSAPGLNHFHYCGSAKAQCGAHSRWHSFQSTHVTKQNDTGCSTNGLHWVTSRYRLLLFCWQGKAKDGSGNDARQGGNLLQVKLIEYMWSWLTTTQVSSSMWRTLQMTLPLHFSRQSSHLNVCYDQ